MWASCIRLPQRFGSSESVSSGDLRVVRAQYQDLMASRGEHRGYEAPSFADVPRPLEDTRMGHHTQELVEHAPRRAPRKAASSPILHQRSTYLMLDRVLFAASTKMLVSTTNSQRPSMTR